MEVCGFVWRGFLNVGVPLRKWIGGYAFMQKTCCVGKRRIVDRGICFYAFLCRKLECVILLLAAGCATTGMYDQLPDNVTKGYVDFYGELILSVNNEPWSVFEFENGKEKRITPFHWIPWAPPKDRHVIVAERSGLQNFVVKLGSGERLVKVEVIEGMIVPVKVVLTNIRCSGKSTYSGGAVYTRTCDFDMSLEVGKPTPFVKR